MKWALIASGSLLLSFMAIITIASADHIPESSVAFQSGSYSFGEIASFIVVDEDLSRPASCTASWGPISQTVFPSEWWSLSTGEPEPHVFSLDEGCTYDLQDPKKTPLRLDPVPQVKINGASVFISVDAEAGSFSVSTRVNASSTLSAVFYFDAPDIYLPTDGLIVVSSSSDAEGEPAGLREVAGENEDVASPDSGIFLGQIDVSNDPDALANGDGTVYAQGGDVLTVRYMDGGGEQIAAAQATVQGVSPTPTPIPATGTVASVALALSLAAILAWKLTRLESANKDS